MRLQGGGGTGGRNYAQFNKRIKQCLLLGINCLFYLLPLS